MKTEHIVELGAFAGKGCTGVACGCGCRAGTQDTGDDKTQKVQCLTD